MHRTTRTMAALASGAALTLSGLTPASAARWSHDDSVGDVMSATYNWEAIEGEDWEEPEYVAEPDNTNTDITRLAVRHSSKRVSLTLTLRDIDARSGLAQYFLRAGDRRFMLMQRLGRERGVPEFSLMSFNNGKRVRCHGVRRSVDRTTEEAHVGLPRRCLGRPAWVRVGGGVISWEEREETSTDRYDDALQEGEGDVDRLVLSPRIRRA